MGTEQMRQNDGAAEASAGLDSHFFTRLFALGTLSALSIIAFGLAAMGSTAVHLV